MRVFDCHVHVQPWEQFRPEALAVMKGVRKDLDRVARALSEAGELLRLMDEEGVERLCLINYVAPEVMGLGRSVNDWVVRFVRGHEDRLVAVGSVNPRLTQDAAGETARLFESGIRMIKLHPPHQLFAADGYLAGDEALRAIYSTAQAAGRPVMIHTGTSIFPGARNRFADPMAADDVAVDFPKLTIILAHAGRPLFMPTATFLSRRHPNVYLDLSGIPPKKLLEYLPPEDLADSASGTDYQPEGRLDEKEHRGFVAPISTPPRERILVQRRRSDRVGKIRIINGWKWEAA
jgi:predicted TIM-barrel fold metal-dependent hydrolase